MEAASTVVSVSLDDGVNQEASTNVVPTAAWTPFFLNFTAKTTCTNATLRVVSEGASADWWIGAVSMTEPANTWRGMRRDVVESLNATGFHGLLRCVNEFKLMS